MHNQNVKTHLTKCNHHLILITFIFFLFCICWLSLWRTENEIEIKYTYPIFVFFYLRITSEVYISSLKSIYLRHNKKAIRSRYILIREIKAEHSIEMKTLNFTFFHPWHFDKFSHHTKHYWASHLMLTLIFFLTNFRLREVILEKTKFHR